MCIYIIIDPDQWTSIPVFVKIYKVLLNELSNICDQGMENQDDDESSDVSNYYYKYNLISTILNFIALYLRITEIINIKIFLLLLHFYFISEILGEKKSDDYLLLILHMCY